MSGRGGRCRLWSEREIRDGRVEEVAKNGKIREGRKNKCARSECCIRTEKEGIEATIIMTSRSWNFKIFINFLENLQTVCQNFRQKC